MTTDLNLPVLVYGTLRPGGSNHDFFFGDSIASEQLVRVPNYRLHGNQGFPYATPDQIGRSIVANAIDVDSKDYANVMYNLDMLEGHRGFGHRGNHYDRVIAKAISPYGEEIVGWMYSASDGVVEGGFGGLPVIPSGDWLSHLRTSGAIV